MSNKTLMHSIFFKIYEYARHKIEILPTKFRIISNKSFNFKIFKYIIDLLDTKIKSVGTY